MKYLIGVLCTLSFFSCTQKSENQEQNISISIAVAANMQFAMPELTAAFKEETGIDCKTIVSSSGKLTAQIRQGAPFDLFISADMKYPNEIYKYDLAATPPKVYAYGQLVLWSMQDGINVDLKNLGNPRIRHIAMANPKTAPYGEAAEEVLRKLDFYKSLQPKLVFGESIAQTNQFIITKSAEIGFTAKSAVVSPQLKGKGSWEIVDPSLYKPILQGAIVIKRKNGAIEAAKKFYNFLSSKKAKDILQTYGYTTQDD